MIDNGVDVRTFGEQYWRQVIVGSAVEAGHLVLDTPQRYYVVAQAPWGTEFEAATDSRRVAVDKFFGATRQFARALIEDGRVIDTYGSHPEYYLAAIGGWYYEYKL
ncbi:hypothetical protein [Pseudobacteriovorax antillogorgiicola]|uniref:Uncharacterized protein n=1 Tax=Pseudobacteriovorax antillogorgiicola TaxID=1513793 RepID=A0A1Y6CIU4_9BACT|nr:hypothetical protein [Pseudobacteriovorax antillogorgiicola]TCS46738.1 hypothetical protein EDD56_123114 [Pseudobacteriovorax antillogorgiicola]SMF67488.1 hypothetical protein SAMN06296036_123114 [Pseudobacteriovorax antillogorgiicola]